MRWFSRFMPRWKPTDLPTAFDLQIKWEEEGKQAGLAGRSIKDCPYESGTAAYNHWVYGRHIAVTPKVIHPDGRQVLCSTSADIASQTPKDYLLQYPDGRITTRDGKPASITGSSETAPSRGKFGGYSS